MVTVVTGLCAFFTKGACFFTRRRKTDKLIRDMMFSALVYAWHGPATHCLTATDSSFSLMSLDVSVEFCFAQAMTIFTALSSLPTLGRPGWDKFAWQVLLWADNFKTKQTYFTVEEIND